MTIGRSIPTRETGGRNSQPADEQSRYTLLTRSTPAISSLRPSFTTSYSTLDSWERKWNFHGPSAPIHVVVSGFDAATSDVPTTTTQAARYRIDRYPRRTSRSTGRDLSLGVLGLRRGGRRGMGRQRRSRWLQDFGRSRVRSRQEHCARRRLTSPLRSNSQGPHFDQRDVAHGGRRPGALHASRIRTG